MSDIEEARTGQVRGGSPSRSGTVGQAGDLAGRTGYRRGSGRILATGACRSVRDRLVPNRFRSIGRNDDQSRLLGPTIPWTRWHEKSSKHSQAAREDSAGKHSPGRADGRQAAARADSGDNRRRQRRQHQSRPGLVARGDHHGQPEPRRQTIVFDISGDGVQTIAPTSSLPGLTNKVTIDGTTQPGYAGTPVIALYGLDAGNGAFGLVLLAGSSTVKGLAINLFDGGGILVLNEGNDIIVGNFIGADPTGTSPGPNGLGILD